MSDEEVRDDAPKGRPESETIDNRGRINLWLVYSLMLVGFLVAIGVALLIVMPFYHRR